MKFLCVFMAWALTSGRDQRVAGGDSLEKLEYIHSETQLPPNQSVADRCRVSLEWDW